MLGLLVAAAIGTVPEGVHPNRLIVQIDRPEVLAQKGYRVTRNFPQIGFCVVEVGPGALDATRRRLEREPGVRRADFDRAARLAYTPNDPRWPDMWHFTKINAHLAWDVSFGSTNTVIAVIDTGINPAHEDLAGNLWSNGDEVPGNGIDDDANGYVDDTYGYDFAYNDATPNDIHGHGTSCSGIAAAVQDNGLGMTGVAPRARIMTLKACDDAGYLYDSYLIPAYLYGADNGAKVFSMSYFSDRVSFAERAALQYAVRRGVLPIAAAGNANTIYPYFPGAYDEVVAVAATTQTDAKASFSNFGSWVDVAAPGVSLHAPTVGGGYTSGFGGTSGACPHVAGLAALLMGAYPAATAQRVREAIEDTALLLNQSPFGEFSNYGRIDAQAAILAMASSPGQKPSAFRYASPLGQSLQTGKTPRTTWIVGRGFAKPRKPTVRAGKTQLSLLAQSRDLLAVASPPVGAPLIVSEGVNQWTIRPPAGTRFVYPLVEASTQSATLTGGFFQTLEADGQNMVATRRSDGSAWIHGSFWKAQPDPRLNLVIRRSYPNGAAANEEIRLYRWSTASYPYGTYDVLASGPCPESPTTIKIPIPDLKPYLDDIGCVYLSIRTNTSLPSGSEMRIDQCYLGY